MCEKEGEKEKERRKDITGYSSIPGTPQVYHSQTWGRQLDRDPEQNNFQMKDILRESKKDLWGSPCHKAEFVHLHIYEPLGSHYHCDKNINQCLGWVAQLVGASSQTPKCCRFDFWSGHIPRFQV